MTKKDILINIAMFATGAAIASVVTWKVLEDKYDKISREEIDSVKAAFEFSRAANDMPLMAEYSTESSSTIEEEAVKIVEECHNIMAGPTGSAPYVNYSKTEKKEEEGGSEEMGAVDKPYVISPEEYDDYDDYNKVMLTYYADHVLADDYDNIIEDVENTVGRASLKTFGEFEADTVYVRNDSKLTDYEITLDTRKYSDVSSLYGYDE